MANAKVIVFDLFDTLLNDIKFDFDAGLCYLYENILSADTDKVEFLEYTATYWKERYDKRNENNSEIAFEDELLDFKDKYGFKAEFSKEEILLNCALKMNVAEVFSDTISTLEQLKILGIPVFLLSNSIFKKNEMTKFINQYDLERYFVDIYFSADHGIRKPHKDFFNIVFEDIKKYSNTIKREQVYFVGDNVEVDVIGAHNFGFTPVFINRKHDMAINTQNFIEIKSLKELFEVIK